ncbi:hypothetical protein [Paracoccus tibetensis]|uniref:Uncharacterized protein n=1 Tax=Paracoccus tibetensis TaxID=336292 RepID=A0A1G5DKJ4_9RHOB|nr:hypothetical protein [Paracoccus tibetensis]SCY15309.1 hypothetical protein SAMN05660710_00849 [Paracoccus tibetensis]
MIALFTFVVLFLVYQSIKSSRRQAIGLVRKRWLPFTLLPHVYRGRRIEELDISHKDLNYLRVRMNAYASLQGYSLRPGNGTLSLGAYQVLLGTLKKIESKANSLAAVVVFLAVAAVTLASADEFSDYSKEFYTGCVAFFVFLVAGLVGGFHHIDQLATSGLITRNKPASHLETQMEKDLIVDLLRKEADYDAVAWSLVLPIVGIIVAVLYVPLATADWASLFKMLGC